MSLNKLAKSWITLFCILYLLLVFVRLRLYCHCLNTGKHVTSRVVYLKNIQLPSYTKLLNLQLIVHLDVNLKDIILFTHFFLLVASKALFYNILWCNIILLRCIKK